MQITISKDIHFWASISAGEIQADIDLQSGSLGTPRFAQTRLKGINQALQMVWHRGIKIGLEGAPQTGRKQIGPFALTDLRLGRCTCFLQVIV